MIANREKAPETKIVSVREVAETVDRFVKACEQDGGHANVLRRFIRSYLKRRKAA